MGERVDARETKRVKVDAFVKLRGGSDREFVFRTRDLSSNGLFLYTKVAHTYPFQVGSSLSLELYDYDEYITCEVVIARVVESHSPEASEYPVGFGVRIVNISEQDAQRLGSMIQRLDDGVAPY